MSNKYSVLHENGKPVSVVWYVDDTSHTVTTDHPRFKEVLYAIKNGYSREQIMRLFSNKQRVNDYFNNLGLYGCHFDGSAVHVNGKEVPEELSKLIIDNIDEGTNPAYLVMFFNKLLNNPSYQSQRELVSFIVRHGLTITPTGNFIAYKGLREDGKSVHSGSAEVDGQTVNGHIPNAVGSTISMMRGNVDDNREVGCSSGLHAGTWSYASRFGHGRTVRVEIDPSDVVSVPKDSNEQKLRVCRYTVVEDSLKKPTSNLVWSNDATTGSYTTSNTGNVLWSSRY